MGVGCGHFKCSLSRAQWSHFRAHLSKGMRGQWLPDGEASRPRARRLCRGLGPGSRAGWRGCGEAWGEGIPSLNLVVYHTLGVLPICSTKTVSVSFYFSSYYCKSIFLLMFTSPTRSFFCEIITFSQCSKSRGTFSYLEALYKNYHLKT